MFSTVLPYLTKDISSVKKSSIVTKTGDEGNTSLWNGCKVLKCSHHVKLLGQLDMINSELGVVKSLWRRKRTEQGWSVYNAPGAGSRWYRHKPCIDSGMYYEWYILDEIISDIQRFYR